MTSLNTITPFLWFKDRADEAVNFYASVFPDSKVHSITKTPDGATVTAEFELLGQRFMAMGAPSEFDFTEAISFMVLCDTQEEVDHYWNSLIEGGFSQACGWLKDRYGVSWQITPRVLLEGLSHPDPERASRAMQAMLDMIKIDVATIEAAIA